MGEKNKVVESLVDIEKAISNQSHFYEDYAFYLSLAALLISIAIPLIRWIRNNKTYIYFSSLISSSEVNNMSPYLIKYEFKGFENKTGYLRFPISIQVSGPKNILILSYYVQVTSDCRGIIMPKEDVHQILKHGDSFFIDFIIPKNNSFYLSPEKTGEYIAYIKYKPLDGEIKTKKISFPSTLKEFIEYNNKVLKTNELDLKISI